MSDKLPDGWFGINDEAWNRSDRASAVVRCYSHDDWQGMVYGPPRMTQAEAEQDRLNLIAGLEGCAGHISAVAAERDAALAELALGEARLAHEAAENACAIKSRNFSAALSHAQRLRDKCDSMRSIIEKQQGEIDNLKAATPQLLRDSMRVTQEESTRIKADMARKDAEIASLRQRVAASEAYAQHLLAALNLRTLP